MVPDCFVFIQQRNSLLIQNRVNSCRWSHIFGVSINKISVTAGISRYLKEISFYEKKGFDASSFKIFIKNFKEYLRITHQLQSDLFSQDIITFENKLEIVKEFLEDRKVFPTIKDVIEFSNSKLKLDYRDQKLSRETTIAKIINQIRKKPELKDELKKAVLSIKNEKVHLVKKSKSKKEIISAETFSKWAEIIKNI